MEKNAITTEEPKRGKLIGYPSTGSTEEHREIQDLPREIKDDIGDHREDENHREIVAEMDNNSYNEMGDVSQEDSEGKRQEVSPTPSRPSKTDKPSVIEQKTELRIKLGTRGL